MKKIYKHQKKSKYVWARFVKLERIINAQCHDLQDECKIVFFLSRKGNTLQSVLWFFIICMKRQRY